ncbi:MAG: pirin family protein, partial [Acidimicrobiia bacterium]
YVVEGTFRHEDNLGNDGILPAGSVQRMTLGSGAWHSEQNGSETEPMRFIQMWILPDRRGLPPEVEQRGYTETDRTDRLLEVVSPEGDPAVLVHADARVYVSRLDPQVAVEHAFKGGTRGAYLYLISGGLDVGSEKLAAGDALKVRDERSLAFRATETSELILVDVPLG